jgi:DNA processing protein
MSENIFLEKQYYNAINIALNADYKKIDAAKKGCWESTWDYLKKDFVNINPEKEFENLEKLNIQLTLSTENNFPKTLKEMPWPPFAIYTQGNLKESPSIAIVGTRKATVAGRSVAKQLAKELAQNKFSIISGLALGIDESAHSGALEAEGVTVAVLPTGIGNIYPKQNQGLAESILKNNGVLLSEFPIKYRPYASSFIQRNRIISALSQATIIIEAPEKSGAMATARFALEQNREIFVVPGPANHPNYKGSHKLIRDGARLVSNFDEIMEDLGVEIKEQKQQQLINDITPEEKIVLEAINQVGWPASVDKISEISKIQVQKINQIIAFLTIKGILK